MNRQTMAILDNLVFEKKINGYAVYMALPKSDHPDAEPNEPRWYNGTNGVELTFDEVENMGEDGTLRTEPHVGINIW